MSNLLKPYPGLQNENNYYVGLSNVRAALVALDQAVENKSREAARLRYGIDAVLEMKITKAVRDRLELAVDMPSPYAPEFPAPLVTLKEAFASVRFLEDQVQVLEAEKQHIFKREDEWRQRYFQIHDKLAEAQNRIAELEAEKTKEAA